MSHAQEPKAANDANPSAAVEATLDVAVDRDTYDVIQYIGPVTASIDPWNAPQPVVLRGEIKQFDAQRLAMIELDGSPRTVPSGQIVRVEPRWRTESAAAAHQLFVEHKYREVAVAVPQALQSNLTQWQQRLLIAELVQTAAALGNQRVAGLYFLNLDKSNPPQLLYADMPLCWTVCDPDQALLESARQWLQDESEAARLLGASWLLLGDQAAGAKAVLAQLKTSQNTAIAQMATLQGWRLTPPPQTMAELSGWTDYRDRLMAPLQLGPSEFMADRLMRIGQSELAIGQWLRIATEHGDRPPRAARALQSAAAQLKRLGREEEAQRLDAWINKLTPRN